MSPNQTLNNWLTQKIEKNASAGTAIRNAIESIWRNKKLIGKGAITGSLGLAAGETGLRTANNIAHGDMSMGFPTTTANISGGIANSLLNAPVIGPSPWIQAAGKKFGDGVVQSPNALHAINALSNITDPNVRNETFDELGKYLSKHYPNVVANTAKSVGTGLFSGVFKDFEQHPIMAPLGATAVTAGPLIAYDLASRKRRKEEADRTNAMLRLLTEKRAAASNTLIKKLLSNFNFRKNPVRSFLATTATAGLGVSVADRLKNPEHYNSATSALGRLGHNITGPATTMVDGIEGAVLKDPGIRGLADTELGQKIQHIIKNIKTRLPEPVEKPVHPMVPYLAGAAALTAPVAAYAGYNHLMNKDYLKVKKENEKLQQTI